MDPNSGRRPFSEIRRRYSLLSEDQKRIADYILSHKLDAVTLTINALAAKCGLSETTVIRFINKLDYSSYQIFRVEMAKEVSVLAAASDGVPLKIEDGYQDITSADSIDDIKRKVIYSAANAIRDIDTLVDSGSLERAADRLATAERIMFYGAGGSASIAMDAHHKFLRLGLTSIWEANSHFAIIRCAHLTDKDAIVLFSHTGESRETLECAANAAASGCRIVGVTSYPNSSLAKASDPTLFSSTNDLPWYTDAMVSRLIQMVLLDMLFISVSMRLGSVGKDAVSRSRKAIGGSKK